VAWQLSNEVLYHAPRDLTRGELAVLMVIAEGARVETRRYPTSREGLAALARLSESGLRNVLRRLRDRDLEVRVPNGRTGADGRPLYAVPGTVVTYQLPHFRPADGAPVGGPESTTPGGAPGAVDNSTAPEGKGGSDNPPAIHKRGSHEQRGGHPVAGRGAVVDPPPRCREPVDAPAPAHEAAAPAVDNHPSRPADVPPLCLIHSDLLPGASVPPCRDCAELSRAWKSRRSQRNRDEVRRRRRCRACDEFGWLLGRDGRSVAPAVRCRHTSVAQKVAPRGHRPPGDSPTARPTSNDPWNAHA
jgi:hypothetical protein